VCVLIFHTGLQIEHDNIATFSLRYGWSVCPYLTFVIFSWDNQYDLVRFGGFRKKIICTKAICGRWNVYVLRYPFNCESIFLTSWHLVVFFVFQDSTTRDVLNRFVIYCFVQFKVCDWCTHTHTERQPPPSDPVLLYFAAYHLLAALCLTEPSLTDQYNVFICFHHISRITYIST